MDGGFHLLGKLDRSRRFSFFTEEFEAELVYGANLINWEDGFADFDDLLVIGDVGGVASIDEEKVWAESFGFADLGAGANSEALGFVAGGDDERGVSHYRADGDGFVA